MRFRQVGNKYDVASIVVKNNTAAAIPMGAPVFMSFNGTDDGLAVIGANAASAVQQNMLAGIIVAPGLGAVTGLTANGGFGEAQVFGFCQSTRLVRQTRATSTDSYASAAAVSVGDILQVNTLTNVDALSDAGAGVTATVFPFARAAQTLASAASSASTTADTSIFKTTLIKTFLTVL